jgi:predicted AAA+ superfamily ATPase
VGLEGGRRAALIIGPRQVGKTTLLLQLANELLSQGWPPGNLTYFDFSDDRLVEQISARSVTELTTVGRSPDLPRLFLLDEISKSVKWAAWLKQAVDTTRDRFLVTDSAASALRGGAVESGQGRWDELPIEGLSFNEFLRVIVPSQSTEQTLRRVPNTVERYLAIGGFPEHASSEDYPQVRERIREDLADRAIIRDLLHLGFDVDRLRKLFVYLAQDSGAIFNASTRARDLGADPRSTAQWVRALEDTRLIKPLDGYSERAAAQLRLQPKIYASDHGLVAAFAPSGSLVRDQRSRSRAVEAVVFRHLRDVAHLVRGELNFFRRRIKNDDFEADFVLSFDRGPVVIEVTASQNPPARKFDRLLRVGQILKASRLIMIHGGVVDVTEDGVTSLSLARFLLQPESVLETRK